MKASSQIVLLTSARLTKQLAICASHQQQQLRLLIAVVPWGRKMTLTPIRLPLRKRSQLQKKNVLSVSLSLKLPL